MPWQFCEIVKSRQTVECAVCGKAMTAEESKVCINPVKRHEGQVFHCYHRNCFNTLIGPIIETLLKGA
jgi:hypothetical protein